MKIQESETLLDELTHDSKLHSGIDKHNPEKTKTPRIVAVDSSAFLFKAYHTIHASKNRGSWDEEAESPVTHDELLRMFIARIENIMHYFESVYAPGKLIDRLIMVFDSQNTRNFRKDIYQGYKANRPPKPQVIVDVQKTAIDFFQAAGVLCLCADNVESDDVFASMAFHADRTGDARLAIVSGDKDLISLCSKNVSIFVPIIRSGDFEQILPNAYFRKHGIHTWQKHDVLCFCGDTSDNIPGIKEVGEKTAIILIHEFGSFDQFCDRFRNDRDGFYQKFMGIKLRNKLRILTAIEDFIPSADMVRSLVAMKKDLYESFDFLKSPEPDYISLEQIKKEHAIERSHGFPCEYMKNNYREHRAARSKTA